MSTMIEPPASLCPLPANEPERLQATRSYEILDTPPDLQFDAITRVAGTLFKVPVALIALMDQDRLWFKSRLGLDIPQLDRSIAFCAHAIMNPLELMVVEDLAAEPLFSHHPLVAGGPMVRFYASAPLLAEGDLPIGTIALLDVKPRPFGAADRAALGDLSVAVMTALEGHKRTQQLSRLATTDHLTGASNRASLELALRRSINRSAERSEPFVLFCMDLDKFKDINDTYGHGAGDAVLREVSLRLRSVSRPDDLIARIGGDEFVMLLGPGSSSRAASLVAERILERLDAPFVLPGGEQIRIRASIGIASCPQDGTEPDELLERADRALYVAKAQINQRWACASPSQPASPIALAKGALQSIAAPVAGAGSILAADEETDRCGACAQGVEKPFPFTMAFQPIVDAENRRVYAYEALVRGTGGEGAASVLDRVTLRNRYAFDQSCRITAIEMAAELGLVASGARLSINFIPGAMYEPRNCIKATLAAARRSSMPIDRIIFEVTENEEIANKNKLREIFDVYAENGFLTAIDDFGAGYSGLSLLTEFQPRILKLDMGLIRGIEADAARAAIVRGVMSISRELGIEMIAEGVETAAEYRALRDLGIRLFQGYLFARPAFEALPDVRWP